MMSLTGLLKAIATKRNFGKLDAAMLKTAMMLAALDGDVSAEELATFKEMARNCEGCTEHSFAKLWEESLRATGYLLVQSRILSPEELVALFVEETKRQFVEQVANDVGLDRDRPFAFLEEMANSDGDFSEIERNAIDALSKQVKEKREEIVLMADAMLRASESGGSGFMTR